MATGPTEKRTIEADPVTAGWIKPPPEWRFDDLTQTYNFPHDRSDRVSLFCSFIRNEAERYGEAARGLDIGCGVGIGMRPSATTSVAKCFGELWGVEPDATIQQAPVFARVQHAVFEQAELPDNYFNLAYSFMVMEHVADPAGFMSKLFRALAPGGTYLFLTVNGIHYFSRIANALRATRVDEAALRMLFGKQNAEAYHYPTQYRFNRPAQIDPVCTSLGFEKPEYVYVERSGRIPYMKGPLGPLGDHFERSRLTNKRPERLLDLFCRVRKPA
ncbi:MAG: class I SAM-dependent methyltransferase [Phycisphaerales bacterium]